MRRACWIAPPALALFAACGGAPHVSIVSTGTAGHTKAASALRDTGKQAQAMPVTSCPRSTVVDLTFAPTGTWLAAPAVNPAGVLLFEPSRLECRGCLPLAAQPGAHMTVFASPDAGTLAVISTMAAQSTLQLVRLPTGTVAASFPAFDGQLYAVAFSPDSRLIATGTQLRRGPGARASVVVWHLGAAAPVPQDLPGSSGDVTQLAFSPDGHRLAAGYLDRSLRVWNLPAGSLARSERIAGSHAPEVNEAPRDTGIAAMRFGREHLEAVVGTRVPLQEGFAQSVDVSVDFGPSRRLSVARGGLGSLSYSATGGVLAFTAREPGRGETLHVISTTDGHDMLATPRGDVGSATLAPDGATVAVLTTERVIELVRVADGVVLHRIEP